MDWDLGNKSNKVCMTNKNNFHCSVKDVCLLLQGARGSWLLEGENWKVTIKSWFKCHLAFDTGSRGKNVGARSWEQIWDLTKVSKGLEEHKNTTSARPRRWSPLHLTRGKGVLEQVSNKAPKLLSNEMHEDKTEWMHSFFFLLKRNCCLNCLWSFTWIMSMTTLTAGATGKDTRFIFSSVNERQSGC